MSIALASAPAYAPSFSAPHWQQEETVLVVDRDGEVIQASTDARRVLAEIGLGADLRIEGELRSIVASIWERFSLSHPSARRIPVRAATENGMLVRAVFSEGRRGEAYASLSFSLSGKQNAVRCIAREYGLTEREMDVVAEVLSGRSTKEIGQRLWVSAYTVQDHLKSIFGKMAVTSRMQLTALILSRLNLGV